ncbi:Cytochrome c/c1 heme-lyase domain-containing protein [Rozella allomycis CSF55]|uniref:Holocytochrome c-type synthase n=1 Tax=Rozella allomycis (strain CSF55) TaxID=988480 RepID=A0A075AZC2_ROZAC|nr:Cytochrome c/c1 heme-lyase domain-containing protein [Rozella allomycis CSF55]|eukprot:EPZ34062.1 Cytochrome c/c1 heme-lyase domain-containing protein [Rozella allomycis CSF55]
MVSEASKCPVNHNQEIKSCPIDHNQNESINPLTQMPYSSTLEAASSVTAEDLSNSREMSTIPRGDTEKLWEYPSPRMFYNALRRKGYETDPADVDMMVDVHNFLNEGVWDEVMKWEKKFHW